MGDNVLRFEPYLGESFPLSVSFGDFMKMYGKGRDKGRTIVSIDEPTEIREDLLRKLCKEKGLSFDEVREAVCESLFKDTESIVEGVRKAAPMILAEHLKRENELFRNLIGI